MQKRIARYLNIYVPRLFTLKYGWLYFFGVCAYIFLSLHFQHPFGEFLSNIPHHHYILSSFGCMFILLLLLFYTVLPRIFVRYFDNTNWTSAKELSMLMLFYVACCITNWICILFTFSPSYSALTYLICILSFSFTFNLLPVIVATLIQAVIYLLEKSGIIVQYQPADTCDMFYCISGKIIPHNDILFFFQDGNYQLIYYVSDENIAEEKERRSMKTLKKIMLPYTRFKSCHISCMVNTDKIEYYTAKSGEKRLKIIGYDKKLNVSNAYQYDFDQYLLKKQEIKEIYIS